MLKPVDLSGGKSVLRSVLNIFVSIYQENKLNWGIFFLNIKKVQVCQCNMGKFEGNSLVRKIVILSRELNPIWGVCCFFGLRIPVWVSKPVDLSGGKSVFRSVLIIFVSQSTEKTSSIGVSFFNFLNVQVCQCNMGKFEENSLIGEIVILSRELKPVGLIGGM